MIRIMRVSSHRFAHSLLSIGTVTVGLSLLGSFSTRPISVQASSKTDRTAGHVLFNGKGCSHCHGTDGVGGERGPSLLAIGRKLKPEAIQHQIEAGGGGMPAFADVLQPAEIQDLVAWLKTQKSKRPPIPKTAAQAPTPANSGGSDDQK